MLRPFNPDDPELKRLDRIMADSGTGLLYGITFALVYVGFIAAQLLLALPRLGMRRAAHFVHGLHHPV